MMHDGTCRLAVLIRGPLRRGWTGELEEIDAIDDHRIIRKRLQGLSYD